MSYRTIKPLLFALDPEASHNLARNALGVVQTLPGALAALGRCYRSADPRLKQTVFGKTFPNPVGMAAGFDKNAQIIPGLAALGFGFVEIGSVTPLPQAGNPKPRLFRFAEQESLQNAMGFNNDGLATVRERLVRCVPAPVPLGVNIGKNKATPQEQALGDYEQLIDALHPYADYLVVNISSPNTPGLRDLQNETFIRELFQMATRLTRKPVLLKIAPDMTPEAAVALCSHAVAEGAAGIIATNTTVDYSLLPRPQPTGGISGHVLREKSFRLFEQLATALYGQTILVSVGGIDSAAEAYRRIRAGASLVQVYSALVFHGPGLARDINTGLLALLARDGFDTLSEAVGADRRAN